jgi:hypothetical protein
MLDRTIVLWTIAACMLTTAVAAQPAAPTTTAFDGRYVGTATVTGGWAALSCFAVPYADMTITGGQVVIHEIQYHGGTLSFQGSVDAAGQVSAYNCRNGLTCTSLSGTIHGRVFEGRSVTGHWCYFNVRMAAAPAPTTAFDGWYRGVSREVLDGENSEHRCDPRALTPPRALMITNGVVGIAGAYWWEGTVSPQGAVVIRNPKFNRIDGEIDAQGTIRGEYRGEVPRDLQAGGGTNCIIKFVWQRE